MPASPARPVRPSRTIVAHLAAGRLAPALACAALAALLPQRAGAGELTSAEIVRRASGVYALSEWHVDGRVLQPPAVEGRFTLLDGTITTILRDHSHTDGERTSVYLGHFVIDGTRFSYRYDDVSQFSESAARPAASHQPLWEGLRAFQASLDSDALRLRAASGQEFAFTDGGLTYLENGAVVRRWRRLAAP
jgi:hypothetical protein